MNQKHEDRILDLIDELNEHPREDFLSGKVMRQWAEKCLEYEMEERAAVAAYLQHAGCPKTVIDLISQGAHRKRSSTAMQELKYARPAIISEARKSIDNMLVDYVSDENR